MSLSSDLISQFVKVTKDEVEVKNETTVYGTIVEYEGDKYVQLDGSDLLTPISSTTEVEPDQRVTVMIKDHTAVVTGNMSSPSASSKSVQEIGNKISEVEILVADKVSTEYFDAQVGRIDTLTSENVAIKERLTASEANIDEIEADNVTINETLTAHNASIDSLNTTKLNVTDATATYATIANLDTTNANIRNLEADYGDFVELTTNNFNTINANVQNLETNKLSATDADLKYANIDFSNIGTTAIEEFFSKSGMIDNLVVGEGTIAGKLVGVTIVGDLIEGGTVKADKLVVKGTDGLYYKLNTDGVKVETEQTDYNSLNGSIITAKSITATKISVEDLVAFGATIGGFHIDDHALYSGAKTTIDNTTEGIYLGDDGQFAIGDGSNFVKYYQDADGNYKLAISAQSILLGSSSKSVETAIEEVKTDVDSLRDEITTLLRIESSRGTVFKNDTISTVLSVVIYHGTQRITDSTTMKSVFGNSAYLQWKWQRLDEETYGIISSSDKRFGDNGFTFTLSPEDVDTKVTFMCELIV